MKQTTPLTSKELYRVITLHEKGNTIREIAKIMDKTQSGIAYHIHKLIKEGRILKAEDNK